MEVELPEKVLFETEIYEIDDDLRIKRGKIRITESRLIVDGNEDLKILYLSGVKMIQLKKENRWGHLISGLVFLVSSIILYSLGYIYGIGSFGSAIAFIVSPAAFLFTSFLMLYWWKVTRSYRLSIFTDFGKEVKIRSREHDGLVKIANAIELVRLGAVRRLQRKG
ncbi:hypothetical protein [Geoglobus acetivorans]|uniref:Uncharacterized protein n=1 Tax=Geoglobus acetivorans TaxID=565033 RepID=A0ABZ3H7J8_GEOAI|nr:hypothetical protein [Geoglobus acetivorans]